MQVYKYTPHGWKWQYVEDVETKEEFFKKYVRPYGHRFNGRQGNICYYGSSRTNWVAVKGME